MNCCRSPSSLRPSTTAATHQSCSSNNNSSCPTSRGGSDSSSQRTRLHKKALLSSPAAEAVLTTSGRECALGFDPATRNTRLSWWSTRSSRGENDDTRLRQAGGSRFSSPSLIWARASGNGTSERTATGLQDDEKETAAEAPPGGLSGRVGSASGSTSPLPTMEDIIATAAQDGVQLIVNSFGPTFEIIVTSPDGTKLFGTAQGFIRVWTQGKILHLESVRLERGLSKKVGNIFGAGFFVGAALLRYGLDRGCRIAQLMAIYDDEATHSKLVKYYSRLGFKAMYEVGEEDWRHIPDRVMWGGVGTRMDADCEELVRRWAAALRPKPRTSASA